MRQLIRGVAVFSLCALLLAGCSKDETPVPGKAAAAPDFTLRDLSGKEHRLADYRGKVVFLNFWATWCPPCRTEIPSMERLNEVMANRDFVMLAVNVDDDPQALAAFVRQTPHNFTILGDADGRVQKLYQVFKFPETFVIDKQGRIVEHIVGARDWSSTAALKFFTDQVGGSR